MTTARLLLRRLAPWLLLVFAIINLAQYALVTQDDLNGFFDKNQGVDDVTRWETRLKPLIDKIPAKVTTVGYISNDPQDIEYVLTQYALIPRVLRRASDTPWIIANFPGKAIHQVLEKQGLKNYSLESFGFGLYLVHKK